MEPGGQFSTRITQDFINSLGNLPQGAPYHSLLLFDFITGSAEIRRDHDAALRQHLYNYLGPGMSIWVIGFASRAGGEYENMNLSHSRAGNVARRISFQSGHTRNIGTVSLGERRSTTGSENSAYRRAVLILVYRRPPYVEPPRPPRAQPLPFFNKFKISLIGGIEGGEVLVGADYHFLIDYDDRDENAPPSAECEYTLLALGGGIGAPLGTQGGICWNYFNAGRNCTPEDFSGRASLGGYGITAGGFSIGNSSFAMFPNNGTPIEFETFQSEIGMSAGISRVYGGFARSGF